MIGDVLEALIVGGGDEYVAEETPGGGFFYGRGGSDLRRHVGFADQHGGPLYPDVLYGVIRATAEPCGEIGQQNYEECLGPEAESHFVTLCEQVEYMLHNVRPAYRSRWRQILTP